MSEERTASDWYFDRHGHRPGEATDEQRRDEYFRLCEVCQEKGFKSGWAAHKFKELFGVWPDKEWGKPAAKPQSCPNCGFAL